MKKLLLVNELQSLNAKSLKLDQPLARALAKAEIADAAWTLEREWAKGLLREAYELTFPDEDEQRKLREQPVGTEPTLLTGVARARSDVRFRILGIAGRDKKFGDQLIRLGAETLGRIEEHTTYTTLAVNAIAAGDKTAASDYLLRAINADPSQITASFAINELAIKDRAAADQLILKYMEQLKAFPLSVKDHSIFRGIIILNQLAFPAYFMGPLGKDVPPPGAAVMKAYVYCIVESFSKVEQREPGNLQIIRDLLLFAWQPLKKYAPELTAQFLELEKASRSPGQDSMPPSQSLGEQSRDRYERRLKDALESGHPDDMTIHTAMSRGDYDKARKMIGMLDDGARKTQLMEVVNMREAMSLADKDDFAGAQRLAEQLTSATSILAVYPKVIDRCVAKKDQACAASFLYQAVKQLKRANTEPPKPPEGIPLAVMPSSAEFDPILMGLSKLARSVAQVDESAALEVLDETVSAANRSNVDTKQGRTGLDMEVFRLLARQNETRVEQSAEALKDPLRQIVALATINREKAEELAKKAERENH